MGAYQVVAKNYSYANENKIHSDEVARKYGFKGALVPGVAVYGYLTYPLVERFGKAWLARSVSNVRFLKPAYDGDRLEVTMAETERGYRLECHNGDGTLLAVLQSQSADDMPTTEDQAVFDAPPKTGTRPGIAWDTIVENQPFEPWQWQITEDDNKAYAEWVSDPSPIYRYCAHPYGLIGKANRVLAREYVMPAWIHVGSEIRFRELLKVGDTVSVRGVPVEKWRRNGHEFIRLYVTFRRGDELTTEIVHTAIFKVAE